MRCGRALQTTVKRLWVVENGPDQSRLCVSVWNCTDTPCRVAGRPDRYGLLDRGQFRRCALGFEPSPSPRPSASCRHPPSPASFACACDVWPRRPVFKPRSNPIWRAVISQSHLEPLNSSRRSKGVLVRHTSRLPCSGSKEPSSMEDDTTEPRDEKTFGCCLKASRTMPFVMHPDGIVKTWNPGDEMMKGYRADEIVGQSVSFLFRV
jgi:hypothetical protein